MDKIIVQSVNVICNKIEVVYLLEGRCREYLNHNEKLFWIEYSMPINNVPPSIAVIPFCANVLPIIWLLDAILEIPELDLYFYNSIDEFKKGYVKMYPTLNFNGKLQVGKLVGNSYVSDAKSAVFFSGGVDAFSTLISHLDESPVLLTLWGADIKLDDTLGWKKVADHIEATGEKWKLDYCFIKTNFREIVSERPLNYLVSRTGYGYWYGFQHGIGIICHAAPIAFMSKIRIVYLASSYTKGGQIACASSPTIDNYVKFSSCRVVNDQPEWTRQDKIIHICDYVKRTGVKIELRVCWESVGGGNCCHCEKCYRTIFGILAEGENPLEYGFNYTPRDLLRICDDIQYRLVFSSVCIELWKNIQDRFIINKSVYNSNCNLEWIYSIDFNRINDTLYKRTNILMHKVYRSFVIIVRKMWNKKCIWYI